MKWIVAARQLIRFRHGGFRMPTPNPLDYARDDQDLAARKRRRRRSCWILAPFVVFSPIGISLLYIAREHPTELFFPLVMLFPFAHLMGLYGLVPINAIYWGLHLAQFPTYGAILAYADTRHRLGIAILSIIIAHLMAAGLLYLIFISLRP